MPAINHELSLQRGEAREDARHKSQQLRYLQQRYIMRLPEVEAVTGYKRSSIYLFMAQGTFPKCRPINGRRAVGWDSLEIDAWIAQHLEG
jgi:prophage regulatory protein